MRAAPERRNADGSVNVLVAFRIAVSNTGMQNREIGYRLRVKMAPDEGQYRIAKIDQVAT
jgi:Mce-associated membrane protein